MEDKGIAPISHLRQNFRTHMGVVNLAQSLNPETSLLCGELPMLLDFGINEDAIIEIFQDQGNLNENGIRFGAEQHALVLTVLDCKGLEFEDVLLYNFFGSSPLKEQWRVIYECMEKRHCLLSLEKYPEFAHARHDVLCYELKQLYVAITRSLIQGKGYGSDMQVASSLKEWRFRGMKMLDVYNYKAAIKCFEHAEDYYWVQFATASELKAAADNSEMLRDAVKLFESIKKLRKQPNVILMRKIMKKQVNYILQSLILKELNLSKIDLDASEQKFLHKCALVSHKQQDKQAMMKYVKDFSSLKSMRIFLKELGCFDELVELELENGNHLEAAKFARHMGNILREADILEQASSFADACQLYLAFVFASSLWADGNKGWPL
ncbi:TPR and ankyrin repeat-containing protein 1 [Bienertia sinuspersici]